jgi:TatD DNase family protein
MKLVDVHAHLDHARFDKDLDKVVERFIEAGGEVLVSSGVNPKTNRKCLEFAKKYDVVRVAFGVYPTDALAAEAKSGEADGFRGLEEFDTLSGHENLQAGIDEELEWIEEHRDDCVAVGEIGLDYNWKEFQTEEMREKQKEIFRKCLKAAKKIDKCVVIHSRKAEADVIDILEEEKMGKVVMHCFNGKKALIRRCIENGWSFSVPAVITRLNHFEMLVGMVPLELLLTETDAPYLSPVVGTRNESANVLVTLKEIARIKGLDVEEVGEKIFENASRLLNFKK